MTPMQFDIVLMQRIEKIKATLGIKAQEYATDDDKLHNFRQAVEIGRGPRDARPSMALVCWRDVLKHLTSILTMVLNPEWGGEKRAAMIDEKIGDAINYMILLEAIFREEMQK